MTTETAKTLQPTAGNPESVPAYIPDPDDDLSGAGYDDPEPASVGWDLSFGSRINFGPDEHGDLRVSLHLSDDALAKAMVYRKVTRDQVIGFARHLLALTKGDDDVETIAASLAETAAKFNKRIEQRAEEIAAPRIAHARDEAQQAIDDLVNRYAADRQRQDDLIAELRRQLDVQLKQVDKHRRALLEISEYAEQHADESEHVRAIENTARMVVGYGARSEGKATR